MQDNVTQAANVERELRLDAKAFRENSIWNQDGDEIRLTKTADRLDVAADFIASTTAQSEAVQKLVDALGMGARALEKAAQVFSGYADLHKAKGSSEGDQKAARNIGYAMDFDEAANELRQALAAHRESQP